MNTRDGKPKSLLPTTWKTPSVFVNRLGAKYGRQRSMAADGHLLLVLHAPPVPDDDERQGRLYWRDADGQWLSTEQGAGLASLERHLEDFAAAVEQIDDLVESAKSSSDCFHAISLLAPMLRTVRHLHETLQDARKAIPEARELIDIRDRAYAIERHAELLHTDANNALQYLVAQQAETQAIAAHQMSVASHRLNVLAALFFPIATLSALFGVNLQHTLETTAPPWPFVMLTVASLVLGLALVGYVLRPARAPAASDSSSRG